LIRTASQRVSAVNGRMSASFKSWMPTGLYARALLIMIVPMVILQSVVAFVFMERHWNTVTRRLPPPWCRTSPTLIDVYKVYPQDKDRAQLRRIAQQRLASWWISCPPATCRRRAKAVLLAARPDAVGAARPADRAPVLDRHRRQVQPGRNPHPARRCRDARVRAAQRRLRLEFGDLPVLDGRHLLDPLDRRGAVPAQPDQPILRLADAAESFGKGREAPNFRPRGAREVRRAAQAFLEMKGRVERSIEQRTAMLAGVSHDLRTILTRFKLELALIGDSPKSTACARMSTRWRHAGGYLAFARGDIRRECAADRHVGGAGGIAQRCRAPRPQARPSPSTACRW
jgi:two-component system osmolarity sensor histidine kinase EnvZ